MIDFEKGKKVSGDAYTQLIDKVNARVEGSKFEMSTSSVVEIDVPFYQNFRLLRFEDHQTRTPLQLYTLQHANIEKLTLIDYKYVTIYKLNNEAPVFLSASTVLDYVRFFFTFVKGRHGRFFIIERHSDIKNHDELTEEVSQHIRMMVEPLSVGYHRLNGGKVKAYMTLAGGLFVIDIYVSMNGRVTMANHKLVLEGLPLFEQNNYISIRK